MNGWCVGIGEWQPPANIVGLIVDREFPQEELHSIIEGGKRRFPGAVWVVRETDKRAQAALGLADVEPLLAPLLPYFKLKTPPRPEALEPDLKGTEFDARRVWRDCELLNTCERVVVCKDVNSAATDWWLEQPHQSLRIVERGKKKRAKRKKGKDPHA